VHEKLTIFLTYNVLFELAVHWLSEDTVKFEVDIGFKRNMQKCNHIANVLVLLLQTVAAAAVT